MDEALQEIPGILRTCGESVFDSTMRAGNPDFADTLEAPQQDRTMSTRKPPPDNAKLDRIVSDARSKAEQRDQGYREQALKLYPWVCGRCAREFTRANLRELTVHHRNHNHDDNPPDGSNWELLCLYCHDNEHSRYIDRTGSGAPGANDAPAVATGNPFTDLKALLERQRKE